MIEVIGLSKKYGNRFAIKDISFKVNRGEIIGFLGPNGAGKSTTMNILTGYISASKGTVKIDGVDILEDPMGVKKKIGYLPESPPLYMDMKVREYLNFVFELKNVKEERIRHLERVYNLVKITDVKDRVIKNLSKGYRQRVGLAQALIGNPELLILDEPTVGLDPKQIIEIRNLIKELGKTHTVILSSHILSEIQAVCDKVIIINKGKIVANEKTSKLSDKLSSDNKILLDVIGDENKIYEIISNLEDVMSVKKINKGRGKEENSFIIRPKGSKDIRKDLSKLVTDSGGVLVGLKLTGLTLEEIFLKLTDESSDKAENGIEDLLYDKEKDKEEKVEEKEREMNNNVSNI